MVLVRLSPSSSVNTFPPFQHYSSSFFTSTLFSSTMSNIYTHKPVQDFTNPFLDFDQGYVRPFTTILPTIKATLIPIAPEEESVLPKKPLTRKELKTHRGYPRGESQGESSGKIFLPSFLIGMLKDLFTGLPFFKRMKGHFPSSEEREERDKHLFVYRYNQGGESSRRCHDFHLFTHFLLSSKRPNTRSNHDMALSYLFLSFHTSKVTPSRRGKQIVLGKLWRTIY